jgi:hypothetical protein
MDRYKIATGVGPTKEQKSETPKSKNTKSSFPDMDDVINKIIGIAVPVNHDEKPQRIRGQRTFFIELNALLKKYNLYIDACDQCGQLYLTQGKVQYRYNSIRDHDHLNSISIEDR